MLSQTKNCSITHRKKPSYHSHILSIFGIHIHLTIFFAALFCDCLNWFNECRVFFKHISIIQRSCVFANFYNASHNNKVELIDYFTMDYFFPHIPDLFQFIFVRGSKFENNCFCTFSMKQIQSKYLNDEISSTLILSPKNLERFIYCQNRISILNTKLEFICRSMIHKN